MSKSLDVVGLGNGIVDALVEVNDSFLTEKNLVKASMELVDKEKQSGLLSAIGADYLKIACGGSVCNSIFTFAAIKGKAGMLTSIGQDNFANFYLDELNKHQIQYSEMASGSQEPTGTSLVMITPDGERTMCTCLGASAELGPDHVAEDLIEKAEYLFIEGYVIASEQGWQAIEKSIAIAKSHGTKIVLTLSAEFVVNFFKEKLTTLLNSVDLLFANETEAAAYHGLKNAREACLKLTELVPEVIVTAGADGAYYAKKGDQPSGIVHVPAISCKPVDLTGAGDAFAAGVLFGKVKGFSPEKSLRLGTYLSYRVITQIGARVDDLSIDELANKAYL